MVTKERERKRRERRGAGETNFASGAVIGFGLQEGADEGFGVLADVFPVALVEDDAAGLALVDEVDQ